MKNSNIHSQNGSANQWVHRNELQRGMYVVALDIPWESTPFMFQGFTLESADLVAEVQKYSEYVLIKNQTSTHNARKLKRLSVSCSAANQSVWKLNAR